MVSLHLTRKSLPRLSAWPPGELLFVLRCLKFRHLDREIIGNAMKTKKRKQRQLTFFVLKPLLLGAE